MVWTQPPCFQPPVLSTVPFISQFLPPSSLYDRWPAVGFIFAHSAPGSTLSVHPISVFLVSTIRNFMPTLPFCYSFCF